MTITIENNADAIVLWYLLMTVNTTITRNSHSISLDIPQLCDDSHKDKWFEDIEQYILDNKINVVKYPNK